MTYHIYHNNLLEDSLKRLSLLTAIVLIIGTFSSCSDNSNPASQTAANQTSSQLPLSKVSFLAMPNGGAAHSLAKIVVVKVTPENGGVVSVSSTYKSSTGSDISIAMQLTFDPGTVSAPTDISISLDEEKLAAEFYPSGITFNKPAHLNATITGLDLATLPADAQVSLFYINDNFCQKMAAGAITVDEASGSIVLTNGELPHFSLYGFGFIR
jgi:hypothetical protein